MASWPTTLPAPQKNIGIVPGDTRKDRRLQSGRSEFRRFGSGKPDRMKALFRLTWAEWDIFKEFYAHELNLGVNWFSADWITDLGYDAHKARILGYPREVALQSYYVDVLCNLIILATVDIVTEDTEWPCEPTGSAPEPPPPSAKSYVYGGLGNYSNLRDCDEYDADTNTWASKLDMPLPGRRILAASTVGISGYIYGGFGAASLQDCDEYTPNAWVSKADMSSPARKELAASTIGSSGYIYAGYGGTLRCDEYTPLVNTWTAKTDMPLPARVSLAASTIINKGYVYGGWPGYSTQYKDCDEYDPNTDAWVSKTDMPLPGRANHAASTIGTAGYIYGCASPYLQDCDEYVPLSDTWSSKSNLLITNGYLAASTIGSSGYIYAGKDTRRCDEYTPDTWASKLDMPLPARYHLAASTI